MKKLLCLFVLLPTLASADPASILEIFPRASISNGGQLEKMVIMHTWYRASHIVMTIDYDSTNVEFVNAVLGTSANPSNWEVTEQHTRMPRYPTPQTNKAVRIVLYGTGNNGTMTGSGLQIAKLRFFVGEGCNGTVLNIDPVCSSTRVTTYGGTMLCDVAVENGSIDTGCAVNVASRSWDTIKGLYR